MSLRDLIDRVGGTLLGDYYLDYTDAFAEIRRAAVTPLDSEGIPRADYDLLFRGHPDVDQRRSYGIHYTPVTVAEYALGAWARHLSSGDPGMREVFLRQANWLAGALRATGRGFGVWLHEFAFPIYRLESPWVSAMAQGQGISVLLRAFQSTQDDRYFVAATSAFGAFDQGLDAGGVSCEERGYLWFEEFPTYPPTHVLNGFIYSLWGVLDFLRVTGREDARDLWDRGISTIRENLDRYELAWWSRYDLNTRHLASVHYHAVHVRQLEVLASQTGDPLLADYHRRWNGYMQGRGRLRRWCEQKGRGLLRWVGLLPRPAVRGVSVHLG